MIQDEFAKEIQKAIHRLEELSQKSLIIGHPDAIKPIKDYFGDKYVRQEINQVLDELRAEIRHFMLEVNPSSSESDYACNYILDLIDKKMGKDSEK